MAEQISHKKSLRVNRLDKDRRQLLKEYYKLDKESSVPPVTEEKKEEKKIEDGNENKEILTENDFSLSNTNTSNMENKPINELTYKELMIIHNKLLGKETEMNNSIKNTIYDNYYDLIKVNDILKTMADAHQDDLDELNSLISGIKTSLSK